MSIPARQVLLPHPLRVLARLLLVVVVLGAPFAAGGAVEAASAAAPAAAAQRWQAPLAGRLLVVRGFDPPAVRWGSGHRGVDLASASGAPVLAAGDGVVGFAGMLAGRGVVTVVHGPLRTTYEPVTASVRPGTPVVRGSVIGHLALTGSHCAPAACLHWGLLRGDTYLDPLLLLGIGQVRLYPLDTVGHRVDAADDPATWAASVELPAMQPPMAGPAGRWATSSGSRGLHAAPKPARNPLAAPAGAAARSDRTAATPGLPRGAEGADATQRARMAVRARPQAADSTYGAGGHDGAGAAGWAPVVLVGVGAIAMSTALWSTLSWRRRYGTAWHDRWRPRRRARRRPR